MTKPKTISLIKSTRAKKPTQEVRSRVIHAKVTEFEYEKINTTAKSYGITVSDFIRARLLGNYGI